MITKKITLNEFKDLVKKVVQESFSVNQYVENIYKRQSEYPAREQLYSFARENGYNSHFVDKALQIYKYDTEDGFGGQMYTKKAIENIINYIIDNW